MSERNRNQKRRDKKGRILRNGESQRADGRYAFVYTDCFGKQKFLYSWKLESTDPLPVGRRPCQSLREKEKVILRDINDGITPYGDNLTVLELVKKYIAQKTGVRHNTAANYNFVINIIKKDEFGALRIDKVKLSDAKAWLIKLQADGRGYSTIHSVRGVVRPAFQMAVDDDLIRKNPCKDCMKEYIRGGLSTTKYPLTRAEEAALLKFVKDDTIYSVYYPMIAFMLGTGCRIGEVIGLTWDDIDFENATLSINHQIIYKKKNGKIRHYASAPKNGTSRIIPLSDDVLDILLLYKQRTYFMSITNDYEVDGYSNFVFLNQNMTLYTPNTLTRAFHNIRNAYNRFVEDGEIKDVLLPDFTAHTFRHTFCTRMAENGMDIKVLQEIMGHKTIAVTMQVYNHALFERKQSEVARIPSALAV